MRHTQLFILTLLAMLGLIPSACIEDGFDRSPGANISFSTDTLSFGTLFTGIQSPTGRLIVRNPNKKGIVISSVSLIDPCGYFSFNVDGVSGSAFSDVEIRGNDSIYIYVECSVPEFPGTQPEEISSALRFIVNGNESEVTLAATATNVRRLENLTISSSLTLDPALPWLVSDTLTVAEGTTLTILPGTTLLFRRDASLRVEGTLSAVGNASNPINFRGDRLDNVIPGVPYDLLAGQWTGISFAPESFGNRLEFTDIRSTVTGIAIDSCADLSRTKLTLVNSWLHNSKTSVLHSRHAVVDAFGCCFSDSPGAVVSLEGGNHRFVQCTIANNYLFAAPYAANLTLSHLFPDERTPGPPPLMNASFENCIVYGMGQSLSPADLTGSSVFMRNVLFKPSGSDDDNFISCIWNTDPLFLTVRADYFFNYRLQPDSPALGKGNPGFVTQECLFDMDGIDRLASGAPALGAYAE